MQDVEELKRGKVEITEEDGVYFVKADWLLKILNTINFDDTDSAQYFQRVLIQTGVIDALRDAGVQEGDTVNLYDLEFDFCRVSINSYRSLGRFDWARKKTCTETAVKSSRFCNYKKKVCIWK